jgi:ribonuclease HI
MVVTKQLSFLSVPDNQNSTHQTKADRWSVYVDGASRNNPGKSGAGLFITKNDIPCYKQGFFLGIKTNNQAEYIACILGMQVLEHVLKAPRGDKVALFSDSLLLVSQLSGSFKVKHPNIKPLYAYAHKYMVSFNATVTHVLREYNVEADEAANSGIDTRTPLPKEFVQLLQAHEITL